MVEDRKIFPRLTHYGRPENLLLCLSFQDSSVCVLFRNKNKLHLDCDIIPFFSMFFSISITIIIRIFMLL